MGRVEERRGARAGAHLICNAARIAHQMRTAMWSLLFLGAKAATRVHQFWRGPRPSGAARTPGKPMRFVLSLDDGSALPTLAVHLLPQNPQTPAREGRTLTGPPATTPPSSPPPSPGASRSSDHQVRSGEPAGPALSSGQSSSPRAAA